MYKQTHFQYIKLISINYFFTKLNQISCIVHLEMYLNFLGVAALGKKGNKCRKGTNAFSCMLEYIMIRKCTEIVHYK